MLLSLALATGNAHAALHLGAAHSEPCPEEHAASHRTVTHHQHQHDKGLACCCDCLGCSSAAYLAPELSITPAELAGAVPLRRTHRVALRPHAAARARSSQTRHAELTRRALAPGLRGHLRRRMPADALPCRPSSSSCRPRNFAPDARKESFNDRASLPSFVHGPCCRSPLSPA